MHVVNKRAKIFKEGSSGVAELQIVEGESIKYLTLELRFRDVLGWFYISYSPVYMGYNNRFDSLEAENMNLDGVSEHEFPHEVYFISDYVGPYGLELLELLKLLKYCKDDSRGIWPSFYKNKDWWVCYHTIIVENYSKYIASINEHFVPMCSMLE